MKYLVTGGNGFVGANLVRRLVKEGNEVWITSRSDVGWRLKGINIAGVYKFEKPEKADFDYIYHLSAAGCYYGKDTDYDMVMANVVDTFAMLTFFQNIKYKAFIYVDSSSSYGLKSKPMQEQDILEPTTIYAATKAAGALLCQAHAKTYNKPIAIARLFSVYGDLEEPSRFIPQLLMRAKDGKKLKLADGSHDWVHIDDVVEALIRMREYADNRGEVYNVGTGIQTTNKQVVNILETIIDKSINYEEVDKMRVFDTNSWVADITKISAFWRPKYDLISGLEKTIKYEPKKQVKPDKKNNN